MNVEVQVQVQVGEGEAGYVGKIGCPYLGLTAIPETQFHDGGEGLRYGNSWFCAGDGAAFVA